MRIKFLSFISRTVTGHPWKVVITIAILTIFSIVLAKTTLKMNTDQDDLVSERLEYHKRYKDYLKEFGDLEYLYVVVEIENNIGRAKEFTRSLASKLKAISDIKEVTYQISNPKLEKSFLLYLPKDQIKAIGEYLPKMQKIGSSADVFAMMNGEIVSISKSQVTSHESRQLETGFRFLDNLLDGLISATKDGAEYKPFLQQAFFASDRTYDEDGFILSENENFLFTLIMPEKNYKTLAVIDEPLKKIRSAIAETKKEFPDVKAGLTGRPVLAADEMSISDKDMTIATIAALLIVTLIFIAYFRRPTRPAIAAVALTCGIIQTFGLTTIVIGHLNILSIVFAVILVGAGIEFGLQIVSRYREELAHHKNVRLAIDTCITQTGKGNITAAMTTAVAFFAACFTNFLALQELGFIAGMGIILCLANMLTLLPALIYLHDRDKHPEKLQTTLKINLKFFEKIYKQPRLVVVFTTIITIGLGLGLIRVGFNHNLLDLQANGLESVKYEKKIIEESSQSTWYVPFVSATREDSLALAEKLKLLPTVGKVETIADIVPEDQVEKMVLISKIPPPPSPSPSRGEGRGGGDKLKIELQKFNYNIAHLTELAFSAGEIEAVDQLENVSNKAMELIQLIPGHLSRIESYDTSFVKDLRHHMDMLYGGLNPEKISLQDMPITIQKRYVSEKTDRVSLYVYPKEDVWDPKKMDNFIKELRTIDPNVTGTPVEVYESSGLMEKSFRQVAFYSLIAIILIVFIDFKNMRLTILALTPLGLGMLWLFELMGLLGIKFNLANFFGIPILLGIGVDNAVQIVHRYINEKGISSISSFMTKSTGIAVLLTSLTTLASFATLVFARHKGIASLGLIMSLGTLTCFIGSMIILPCALKIFTDRQDQR